MGSLRHKLLLSYAILALGILGMAGWIAEEKSDAVLNSLYEPVIVTGAHGEVIWVNRAASASLAPAAAWMNRPVEAIGIHAVAAAVREVIERGGSIAPEGERGLARVEGDGGERFYRVRTAPVTRQPGGVVATVTVLEDVTRMRQLDRMKDEFISVASHELRTPLTSIQMAVQLLTEGAGGALSDAQSRLVRIAVADTRRLEQLTKDLLDLTRLEAGTAIPAARPVRPHDIDEPNIRETMQLALDTAGYATMGAADGPAGLEAFGSGEDWDLVLLDQRMPGMDGLEVLRRIKERRMNADVIMVTAFATVDLAVDAMRAGALDFLRKPFTPEVLRQTVASGLARARVSRGASQGPAAAGVSAPAGMTTAAGPPLRFRSLDGYEFWPDPGTPTGDSSSPGTPQRSFVVKAPDGHTRHCTLVFTKQVRNTVRREVHEGVSPADRIWDAVSWVALMDIVWQRPGLPPDRVEVAELTREQLALVRGLVTSPPFARQ
jgi:CheY-like chemotaxis protein